MKNALQLIQELCDFFFAQRDIAGSLALLTDDIHIYGIAEIDPILNKVEAEKRFKKDIDRMSVCSMPFYNDEYVSETNDGFGTAFIRVTMSCKEYTMTLNITATARCENGESKLCLMHLSEYDVKQNSPAELIEHVSNGFAIYHMSVDGKLQQSYVNRNYFKICECKNNTSTDVLKDCIEYVHPDERNELENNLESFSEKLTDFKMTYRYITGLGVHKWIYLIANAVSHSDGSATAYFTFADLTQQLNAQKQLTDIIHTVPCGICHYLWDGDDLHPLLVNNQFSEMLGESAINYLKGVKHMNYTHVHPDDLAALQKESLTALTLTHKIDTTYRSLNIKTNKYLWIRMRGTMLPQPDGTQLVYVSYYDITQEHNSEQKLHESEKLLELAANNAGLWYWRYDTKKDIAYLDQKNQNEFCLPKVVNSFLETWLGMNFLTPKYAALYREAYNRIKHGEPQVIFEVEITLKDNKPHWARYCLTNVFDDNGNATVAVCTGMLIDSEKEIRAKYELEKKKTFLTDENLLAHAIFNLTTSTTIEYTYQDGTTVPMEKRDAFEFSKDNCMELLIDDEERRQFLALNDIDLLLKRFENGESEFRLDYRRRIRSGKITWVRSTLHIVRDPYNNDLLLFEYWYDIEEEKMMKLMYSSIANDNYDFVARVSLDDYNYIIFPKKGLIGNTPPLRGNDINIPLIALIDSSIVPDDKNEVLYNTSVEGIKHNLAEQERFQFTYREKLPNGVIHYKKITEYYLDRLRGIIIVTREDITDLIHTETEKNEMLVTALEAANQASYAKSQFLSRVSHELRTPLNAIIGFIELAKDAEPNRIQSYLSNSDIAAKQLLNIINDVLDMSSIESGKLKINHSPFDFKHMIHAITNIYLSQCKEKGLLYETRILTPIDEWLMGDQLRINQILLNLLNNAVKFTARGHIWLTISQFNAKDNKAFIRFEVSDTGCGMTKQMKERLFKPFEQESAATAQKYGGNGLGLSIVNSLIQMMDGVIRVDSEQGKGTTFTVDIPFAKSEIDELVQIPDGIEGIRVLTVDDEPAEREYLSIVLKRIGVDFTCVDGGDSALEALEKAAEENRPYNLCLVDWKIPNMNGMEITKRIRNKYGNDVIVIVVSAYEHYQADESAKEAGANMFIAKPLFQSTLLDLFMTITGGRIVKEEEAPATCQFAGKRILLAEDNAMNRMVAEGLINKLCVECECAEDGTIAVEKFTSSAPGYYDAILMDIQMPNMDGFEATIAIRGSEHPDAKTIQIIALTANAFNEDIARTLSSGMNAHVTKPIEPNMLVAALDKAFAVSDALRNKNN